MSYTQAAPAQHQQQQQQAQQQQPNTKFDLELNPFEQSFRHDEPKGQAQQSTEEKQMLPPVSSLASPSLPPWFSTLRNGPLSPAMLGGPTPERGTGLTPALTPGYPTPTTAALLGFTQTPSVPKEKIEKKDLDEGAHGLFLLSQSHTPQNQQMNGYFDVKSDQAQHAHQRLKEESSEDEERQRKQSTGGLSSMSGESAHQQANGNGNGEKITPRRTRKRPSTYSNEDENDFPAPQSTRRNTRNTAETEDEKRRNFLERNRQAALKCRQRKKQWLQSLQQKVETYGRENEQLKSLVGDLQSEIGHLKQLLSSHSNCQPRKEMELYNSYGM